MIQEIKKFNEVINNFNDIKIRHKNFVIKKVYFLRNEQVENFANKINNFSEISKIKFKFSFSGYDNNLPIVKKKYDFSILWIDYSDYKINKDFFDWIKNKANQLSSFSNYVLIKPILLPNLKKTQLRKLNSKYKKIFKNEKIVFLDIADELLENEVDFWDLKRSEFFGTKVSLEGQDLQSKLFGLKIFPSFFRQKIKSIIFDLDDTLYNGVIGEDGIKKIYLDKNQKKASKIISAFHKEGTLLSICSKNNQKDVEVIFRKNLLNKKIFFPVKANWNLKSKNIHEIQKILKVSYKNILFIDNNISEIIEVKKNFPDINVFWAKDSNSFLNCLRYYPNLYDFFGSTNKQLNKKRLKDLKASREREHFLNKNKDGNYFSQLKMKIEYRLNNKKEIDRIFSLANKVNQFIFSFKRFSKNKISEYFKNPNKFIFTISLKDKFSDSGNIGVIFFSKNDNKIILDEICISCRALGRNLEDYFIFYPLKILSKNFKFESLTLKFSIGPKNYPARKYFEKLHKLVKKDKKIKNKIILKHQHFKKINIQEKDIQLKFKK